MVRMAWKAPDGTEQSCPNVPDLDEARREQRRLVRVGCSDVRIFTDAHALGGEDRARAQREAQR